MGRFRCLTAQPSILAVPPIPSTFFISFLPFSTNSGGGLEPPACSAEEDAGHSCMKLCVCCNRGDGQKAASRSPRSSLSHPSSESFAMQCVLAMQRLQQEASRVVRCTRWHDGQQQGSLPSYLRLWAPWSAAAPQLLCSPSEGHVLACCALAASGLAWLWRQLLSKNMHQRSLVKSPPVLCVGRIGSALHVVLGLVLLACRRIAVKTLPPVPRRSCVSWQLALRQDPCRWLAGLRCSQCLVGKLASWSIGGW